ncbi:MAG: hypothetical protein ACK515_10785 [bacterium]
MSNGGKMQDRLGTSPGGQYGNRNFGATERDLGNAMGMVTGGPGRLPPEGVQSMASRFIAETGGNSARATRPAKPGGPKPARGGTAGTLASTGYSDLSAAFDALEGRDRGVKMATMQPGSPMGGTAAGPALGDFTDMGIQRAADARMLAAGNIYADPVATASITPTAAQTAVTEAMAYAPQRPRMKMTIPGLMASNAVSMAGGGRSGNSGEGQSRGSAWGAGGSRPTGGGAGGERTGARSFFGR